MRDKAWRPRGAGPPLVSTILDIANVLLPVIPHFPFVLFLMMRYCLHVGETLTVDIPTSGDADLVCNNITFYDANETYRTKDNEFNIAIFHPVLPTADGFVPHAVYQVTVAQRSTTEPLMLSVTIAVVQFYENATREALILTSASAEVVIYKDCGFDAAVTKDTAQPSYNISLNLQTTESATGCFYIFVTVVQKNTKESVRLQEQLCQHSGCIQYKTDSFGAITSPRYPGNYPDEQFCTTYIHSVNNYRIHLQFQHFDLESPYEDACVDYVSITNSPQNASQRLCGSYSEFNLTNLSFVSDGNLLVVKFVSDGKHSGRGYKAVYYTHPGNEIDCNRTLTAMDGNITSVNYPNRYFPNLHCVVTIEVPLDYRIALVFDYLDLKESHYMECADYLQIYSSQPRETGQKLCGSSPNGNGTTVYSSRHWMTLYFRSDHVFEGTGFFIRYQSIKSCNNQTYQEINGTITSINYPDHYLNNQECYIFINISQSWYVIELHFEKLHTENLNNDHYSVDADCMLDYVEIYDGQTTHRACGNWQGREHLLLFRSVGATTLIKFVSNSRVSAPGFVASWKAVINDTSKLPCLSAWLSYKEYCFEIVEAKMTWSDAEANCNLRGGHLAKIDSADIGLFLDGHILKGVNHTPSDAYWIGGNDRSYESDFFWTDGSSFGNHTNWFPGWRQYNDYNKQPNDDGWSSQDCVEIRQNFGYPSKGYGLTDRLYWNDRDCNTRNGFICQKPKIKETSTATKGHCSYNITLSESSPNGTFTSPNFPELYSNFLHCTVHVIAPMRRNIEIRFTKFELEPPDQRQGTCEYDYVLLKSVGVSGTIQSQKRLCGYHADKDKLLYFVTKGQQLIIDFSTDHSRVFSGFSAFYQIFQGMNVRHQRIMDSLSGNLSSEGYPLRNYSDNTLFSWEIVAPPGYRFAVLVNIDYIEYQNSCSYDYLIIQSDNSSSDAKSLCGENRQKVSFLSQNSLVIIRFKTDFSVGGRGFSLSWKAYAIDLCANQNVSIAEDITGHLTSFHYPHQYFNNLACRYVFTAREDARVWIEFKQLALDNSGGHCYDLVVVTLAYRESVEETRLCGVFNRQLPQFLSESNSVILEFHSDSFFSKTGFYLVYRSVSGPFRHVSQVKLPGNSSGNVTSLGFPYTYPSSIDYEQLLVAPLGYHIRLTFRYIDVEQTDDCTKDFVEVLDKHNAQNTSSKHDRLCSREETSFTRTYFSFLNKLWLRLVTDSDRNTTFGGYIAHYEVVLDEQFKNKTERMVNLTHCSEDTCQNGGECLHTPEGVRCQCTANFTGILCHLSQCEQKPCGDHGDCYLGANGYKCACHHGYLGDHCTVLFRECAKVLCSNRGICNRDGNVFISCTCNSGWTGSNCSVREVMPPRVKTIGERLLEEPFWIGIIVVLSVLVIAGFVFFLKKRCGQYISLKCCVPSKKDSATNDKGRKASTTTETYSNPSFTRDPSPLSFGRRISKQFIKPTITIESDSVTHSPTADRSDHVYSLSNGDVHHGSNSPSPSMTSLHTIEEEPKQDSHTSQDSSCSGQMINSGNPFLNSNSSLFFKEAKSRQGVADLNTNNGLDESAASVPSEGIRSVDGAMKMPDTKADDVVLIFEKGSLEREHLQTYSKRLHKANRSDKEYVIVDMHPPPNRLLMPSEDLSKADDIVGNDGGVSENVNNTFRHRRVNSAQRREEFIKSVRQSRQMSVDRESDAESKSHHFKSISLGDREGSIDSSHSYPQTHRKRHSTKSKSRSLEMPDSENTVQCHCPSKTQNKLDKKGNTSRGITKHSSSSNSSKSKTSKTNEDKQITRSHHRSGSSRHHSKHRSRDSSGKQQYSRSCSVCSYSHSCGCSESDDTSAYDSYSIKSFRSADCVERSNSKSSSSSCSSNRHHHHHQCRHCHSHHNHNAHSDHHHRHQSYSKHRYKLRYKLRGDSRSKSIDSSRWIESSTVDPLHRNFSAPSSHNWHHSHSQRVIHDRHQRVNSSGSNDPGRPPRPGSVRTGSVDSSRSSHRLSSAGSKWSSAEVDSAIADTDRLLKVPSFDTVFPSDNDSTSNGASSEHSSSRLENEALSSSGISADIKKMPPCQGKDHSNTDDGKQVSKTVFRYPQSGADLSTRTTDELKASPEFQASIVNDVLAYINQLPSKNPLRDSAYQSKEQSTEKCSSKPGSNAVSPTPSVNGFGKQIDDLRQLKKTKQDPQECDKPKTKLQHDVIRGEENSITSQLKLAAKKLAALKNNMSDTSDSNLSPEESTDKIFQRGKWSAFDNSNKSKRSKAPPLRMLSMIADDEAEHAGADENVGHPLQDLSVTSSSQHTNYYQQPGTTSSQRFCIDDISSENVTEL